MSNSSLIHWFEELLFGSRDTLSTPPSPVSNLILRMEAENIPWAHIILRGGFTAFPYQVHGDLNNLIDHLEKEWLVDYKPRCETRAVSKFWDQLQVLLAKRDENHPSSMALPVPSRTDDAILRDLLDPPPPPDHHHHPQQAKFQSAEFWGQVARRFIHIRRPETAAAVAPFPPQNPTISKHVLQRLYQLYTMTCVARGQSFDPLTMHFVHHSEYVNAAHWQSPANLEAFMHDQPSHPLSLSVQALLKRTVDQFLHAESISAFLSPCPRLAAFLHNVRVIHQSVEEVPHDDGIPPKLIDVFQRLLALSRQDTLWEKTIPPATESRDPFMGTSLLYLTEQLRIAEREKRLLWNHVIERAEASGPKQPLRICSDSPDASDTCLR